MTLHIIITTRFRFSYCRCLVCCSVEYDRCRSVYVEINHIDDKCIQYLYFSIEYGDLAHNNMYYHRRRIKMETECMYVTNIIIKYQYILDFTYFVKSKYNVCHVLLYNTCII